MTFHGMCNESNTTGASCGAGTVYPSRTHELSLVFSGFVLLDLKFCVLHFVDRCLSFGSFSLALVKKNSQHNEQKTPQKTKDRAT